MKKQKFSLLLNIATIALCVCAIAIGVYSAKQTNLSISGSIGFTAFSNAKVECTVVGANYNGTLYNDESSPLYLTTSGIKTNNTDVSIKMTKDTPSLTLKDLSFAYNAETADPIDMVFTFKITNTITKENATGTDAIVADLNLDNLVLKNVKATVDNWVQIITASSDTTSTGDISSTNATIKLTLKLLKNIDIENAVSGTIMLNVQNAEETVSGFSGQEMLRNMLTSVPQGSGELTIPAYLYSSNKFTKIEVLLGNNTLALTNISGYTDVIISNGIKKLSSNPFYGCSNLKTVVFPSSCTTISGFNNCTNLTTINIPQGCESVSGFEGCSSLTKITIPDSVTSMGSFDGCSSLTKITIPDSVTSIGSFDGCTSLAEVIISEDSGLKTINGGFSSGPIFTEITLPSSITVLGSNMFNSCLKKINYCGTKEQWNKIPKMNDWMKKNDESATISVTINCTDGEIIFEA